MDDFRLRVFVTAARTLNFSKCAEAMNITQPAVSRHIGEIEAAYGLPLFNRSSSGVSLTKAGTLLLKHAETILSAFGKMDYDMRLLADSAKGKLSIGASTTIAMYLMPSVLASFMDTAYGLEISMLSANSEKVEQWLKEGLIDIGFVENASRLPWLHYEHLLDDELVLIAGTERAGFSRESVNIDELRNIPLVLREKGSGTREILSERLAACGLREENLNVVIELSSTEAIKSFVRNSDAMAVVSVIAIRKELADGSLRIVDIDGVEFDREFATVVRRGEFSGLNEKFHNYIRRTVSL